MCLNRITKKIPIDKGYKVGFKTLTRQFNCFNFTGNTNFDEWVNAKSTLYLDIDIGGYILGFHICKNLTEARKFLRHLYRAGTIYENYKIYPCQYIGVLAEGIDETGVETIVASYIKISSKEVENEVKI